MHLLTKLALSAALLAMTSAAEARGGGSGASRSSGANYRASSSNSSGGSRSAYIYRNPYAAHPSVRVRDYTRSSGTYVERHVRTPANGTPYDNLSYRGYPSQQPGYVTPRAYDTGYIAPVRQPRFDGFDATPRTLPYISQPYRVRTY